MSFFYDFLSGFCINDDYKNLNINYIEDKGIAVVGEFKILTLNDSMIRLKSKNKCYIIEGNDFVVRNIAKGEMFVFGKVKSIYIGDVNDK